MEQAQELLVKDALGMITRLRDEKCGAIQKLAQNSVAIPGELVGEYNLLNTALSYLDQAIECDTIVEGE